MADLHPHAAGKLDHVALIRDALERNDKLGCPLSVLHNDDSERIHDTVYPVLVQCTRRALAAVIARPDFISARGRGEDWRGVVPALQFSPHRADVSRPPKHQPVIGYPEIGCSIIDPTIAVGQRLVEARHEAWQRRVQNCPGFLNSKQDIRFYRSPLTPL